MVATAKVARTARVAKGARAAAKDGHDPRELIRGLQASLCTINRNDPLEKVGAVRWKLAAIYHLPNESLMSLKKRLQGAVTALEQAVEILAINRVHEKVEPDEDEDDQDVLASNAAQRASIRHDLVLVGRLPTP
jgi:hypothetical protein